MPKWIAVPECPECGDVMREDDEGDWECTDCNHAIYSDELDD